MGQQQFKLSFTVGTKLLISIVLLLTILIAFLNIAAIILLKEDKQAYTFEAKSTESVLTGREFVNTVRHVVDTLRLSLATIDPAKPVTSQQTEALRSLVDNQSDVISVAIQFVDPNTGKTLPITGANHRTEFAATGLSPQDTQVSADWLKTLLPEIRKTGIAFANLSKVQGIPMMAVILGDLGFVNSPSGIPIAVGIVPLKKLDSDLAGLNLTIATRSGWVIFDTDKTVLFSKRNISDDPLFDASNHSQFTSGTKDFEAAGIRYLGSYYKPGFDLVVLSKAEWEKAMRATYALTEKFALLGLMSIGAGIIFAIFFSKTLTAPIKQLYEGTQAVAKGQFDLNLELRSRDEIGALTNSFNVMSHKIQELFVEQKEKLLLEAEVNIASTVQQTLIPPPEFDSDFIRVRSFYQAASKCGGDWWGIFQVDNKICFGIADATGHGLPCALITAAARSCFSVIQKMAQEGTLMSYNPGELLSYANRVIHDSSGGKINMTFFMGVIDLTESRLYYANAGHNPPWLYKKQGDRYKLNSLTAPGTRLGEAADVPPYEEKSIDIDHEDILFMYTDGLTEGKSTEGEMFGKKRVRQIIEATIQDGPDHVVYNLINDFNKFNAGKPLDDDVTIAAALLLQGEPPPEEPQEETATVG